MTEAIVLLVTSSDGSGKCQQAVAKVLDQLINEAETEDFGIAIALNPGRYGPQSVSVSLDGKGADALAKSWLGTIR